jgi:hypothetical protein
VVKEENSDVAWTMVGKSYVEMMDEVMPFLNAAEQIVYQRLFRLSYVLGKPFTQCRYDELREMCGISLSTLQRALRGLRSKKLVRTVWQSHGASTFQVQLLSTLPHRPVFLPKKGQQQNSSIGKLKKPPVYSSFTAEDRELFLACKRSLSPQRLSEITEQAVEWLTEKWRGNTVLLSDEILRDKVDELILKDAFGPERLGKYAGLFTFLDFAEQEDKDNKHDAE